MAILKWSGIGIVGSSGKLQGTVLLSNNIARVWHKTKTVRNASTNYVKGIFSGISSSYKTLTPAQLLSWKNAVVNYLRKNSLAEVRTLTASQAFQRVNNILTSLGLVTTTTAPGTFSPDTLVVTVPAAAAGAATFTVQCTTFYGAASPGVDNFIKIYATPQFTASKQSFSKSDYRLIGFITGATTINPAVIHAMYIAAFGALVAGQRIGIAMEWIYATPAGTNLFHQAGKIYSDCIVAA